MLNLSHGRRWPGWWLLAFWLFTQPAWAHKPSDSYLVIDAGAASTLEIQWDVALKDLALALGVPAAQAPALDWPALQPRTAEVDAYLVAHLDLSIDGQPCRLIAWSHQPAEHSDGNYLVSRFRTDCASSGQRLGVAYHLFFDLDPMHRGLLRLKDRERTRSAVLGPDPPSRSFDLAHPSLLAQLREYAGLGIWHIWRGIDHVLFLLSLLLPSVLVRTPGGWQAAPRLRTCLLDVLRVVTAFTVAHSITLSLSALGLAALPSRLVESTIAASVLLAALNNLWPLAGEGRWRVAFVFGLIHGFGFASVLTDLGLPRTTLVAALAGFNLGVEAGQLAIVAAFVPLVWYWRASAFYRRGVLGLGSLLVAALAATWLVERVFDLRILPFTV